MSRMLHQMTARLRRAPVVGLAWRPAAGASCSAALRAPARSIATRFNFDTYKLVRQLERQELSRGQAVAIMRTINAFLVDGTLSLRAAMLSTIELENEVYMYKAQLQELRNELQLLRQNDSANLRAEAETVMRDIDALGQKFSELLATFKAEVAMELNHHKSDARELGSETDIRIQEIHHKLVLRLSDIKTKIETMKVELTRMIVWMVIGLTVSIIALDWIRPSKTPADPPPDDGAWLQQPIQQQQHSLPFAPFGGVLAPNTSRPKSM